MGAPEPRVRLVRFADFEADFTTGELRKHGVRLRVPEQSLEILLALVEHPGELVSREMLRARLWPEGTFVDFEHGLNAAVRRLRDALGDTAREPRFVETLPRRGYRFIGELEAREFVSGEAGNAPSVEDHPSRGQARPARSPSASENPGRRWRALLAGAAVLAALGAAVIAPRLSTRGPEPSLTVIPFTSFSGQEVAPAFSPDGSQVAFSWAEKDPADGGGFDLYSKVVGSEKVLRLTRKPANWISPAWSPDGRSIAFSRWGNGESGVYVIPALGGEERKLASVDYNYPPVMGIAWSPDGRSLVFISDSSSLSTISLETLERKPLPTQTKCLLAGNPAFSPDGRNLAFTCNSDYGSYGIYTASAGGGRAERIAQVMGNPEGLAWSRDGSRIVFSSDPGINEGRLWVLDVATRRVEALPLTDDARRPAFSPDGARLAYARGYDNVNIWRLDPGSGAVPRRFIFSTRIQHSGRFSPDGRRVAFQSTRSGAHEVWLADADGSNAIQATHFSAGISGSPTWCSDSRRIAFDSRVSGPAWVYVENIFERIPRRIQTNLAEISLPTWSRDCRWLYVASGPAKAALFRVPANGGNAELAYDGVAINASESVDGRALYFADAFENARILRLVPGQKSAEELPEMPRVRFGTAWQLADGGIYFIDARSPEAGLVNYYDFATRATRRIAQLPRQVVPWTPLSVSPLDGSVIYSQVDEKASDLMLVEFSRPY